MARISMVAYTNYERDPRVRRQAEALIAVGHEVIVLARAQAGRPGRRLVDGVELVELPGITNSRLAAHGYILDYLLFFIFVFIHLSWRPNYYSLVHVNNMPDFLVFAAAIPRLFGRPVIHDVHDLMPELFREKFSPAKREGWITLLRLQERWAGRFATAVLTVEEGLKEILAKRGIPREKITVLMNLPDERIFAGRPPAKPRSSATPFVLVYHGTLARRLGLDLALEAVALLRGSIPRLQLRIIGAGEERAPLLALRETLGLCDAVTFSDGFVPVEAIPSLVADADVGLVPLRVSNATEIMLPTKLLEYVCLGIPCIAPRTNAICRYFDDESLQFFRAGDVRSMADAILALYKDAPRRENLARTATAQFGVIYRWSQHKGIYIDLVTQLLSTSRGARGRAVELSSAPGSSGTPASERAGRPTPR